MTPYLRGALWRFSIMAQDEQDNQRGFRVNDRRRFSPQTGEPWVPKDEQEQTFSPDTDPEPNRVEQPHSQDRPQAHPEISFSSFILGLSTQALMHMGEISTPEQPPLTDLAAAQEMIDIISMLQLKTAGNLDSGEESMIENVLFDLRMRYVEIARRGHPSGSQGE